VNFIGIGSGVDGVRFEEARRNDHGVSARENASENV
jgi:hypothetical protein